MVLGVRQINTCRKVPLQDNFLDDDIHFPLPSVSLIFLRVDWTMVAECSHDMGGMASLGHSMMTKSKFHRKKKWIEWIYPWTTGYPTVWIKQSRHIPLVVSTVFLPLWHVLSNQWGHTEWPRFMHWTGLHSTLLTFYKGRTGRLWQMIS